MHGSPKRGMSRTMGNPVSRIPRQATPSNRGISTAYHRSYANSLRPASHLVNFRLSVRFTGETGGGCLFGTRTPGAFACAACGHSGGAGLYGRGQRATGGDREGESAKPRVREPQRRAQQFGAAHLDRRRRVKLHSKQSRVDGDDVMRRGAAVPVWTQKLTDEERVNPAFAGSSYRSSKPFGDGRRRYLHG